MLSLFVLLGLLLENAVWLPIYKVFHFFCSLFDFSQILGLLFDLFRDGLKLCLLAEDVESELFYLLTQLLGIAFTLIYLLFEVFHFTKQKYELRGLVCLTIIDDPPKSLFVYCYFFNELMFVNNTREVGKPPLFFACMMEGILVINTKSFIHFGIRLYLADLALFATTFVSLVVLRDNFLNDFRDEI